VCDTLVLRGDHGFLLAKNSDRDVNEAQLWEWTPAADHEPGADASLTWVAVPQVARTHATVVSRPWWMWGAEMGANEHGVAIGNEAVFTKAKPRREPGVLGMDLLRLALERAASAREAVAVIVDLLEEHGQSGPCSHEHPRFTYDNSFLVADRHDAIVLETADRAWATEDVTGRARSISNGLTIPGFAERWSDRLRSRVSGCAVRRGVTQRRGEASSGVADLIDVLRDHGNEGGGPRWSPVTGSMTGPNMHGGGLVASSQTVSSWVSDLAAGTHWATGTAEPALSVFVPLRVDEPLGEDTYPVTGVDNTADDRSHWWRHERLHRLALRDLAAAEATLAGDRDSLQRAWLAEPPRTADALSRAAEAHDAWADALEQRPPAETRPWWLRRRWASYDRAAGRTRVPAGV
jgi:dipeptidase